MPRLAHQNIASVPLRRHYVPGHDPLHRFACLTLYRRLLSLSKTIPLPKDLPTHPTGPRNPIAHQIRKAFVRNGAETSARLVSSALRSGYKAIALLKDAQNTQSPQYHDVVTFLQNRRAESDRSRAAQPLTPEQRLRLKEKARLRAINCTRILDRVPGPPPLPPSASVISAEDQPKLSVTGLSKLHYHYERAPTFPLGGPILPGRAPKTPETSPDNPFAAAPKIFPYRYRAPTVDHVERRTPFLRYKRPQPRMLTHVLRQKTMRYLFRLEDIQALKEEEMIRARWEDEWDRMVETDLEDKSVSFTWSVRDQIQAIHEKVDEWRMDAVARTHALTRIMEEEKAQRAVEKAEKKKEKRRRQLERWWERKYGMFSQERAVAGSATDLKRSQALGIDGDRNRPDSHHALGEGGVNNNPTAAPDKPKPVPNGGSKASSTAEANAKAFHSPLLKLAPRNPDASQKAHNKAVNPSSPAISEHSGTLEDSTISQPPELYSPKHPTFPGGPAASTQLAQPKTILIAPSNQGLLDSDGGTDNIDGSFGEVPRLEPSPTSQHAAQQQQQPRPITQPSSLGIRRVGTPPPAGYERPSRETPIEQETSAERKEKRGLRQPRRQVGPASIKQSKDMHKPGTNDSSAS